MAAPSPRSGGRVLVDSLVGHGVDMVFCVPGESYLATLDAFYDARNTIRVITCRHEAGAANMAEAYGKLTGRPGVCFVTRGPGACHASIGLHTGLQDSTPMVLFIGQIERVAQEREAFQEIDYRRMYGPLAKWVGQIDNAARIPEMVSHAFYTACAGRPGPVVLAIPEDMQMDVVTVADADSYKVVRPHPAPEDIVTLKRLLAAASRPLMILGGGGWSAAAVAGIRTFAEAFDLPVAVSFRSQDLFDNTHRNYAGDLGSATAPSLVRRVKESDLLIAVGARLGEMTTQGYSLIELPRPKLTLIHVHADAEELGRVFQPDLPINASPTPFAAALEGARPDSPPVWAAWTRAANQDYRDNLAPGVVSGALDMNVVMKVLAEKLAKDAIVVTDAGNYSGWVQRYHQSTVYRSLLGPTSGAMGYGVPAAVAAGLVHPERETICFVGDGGFLMSGQEIATALQFGAKPIILIVNNGLYGTIRMHQERDYPGRSVAVNLQNPDFAAYAKAFGAYGEVVEKSEDFAPALARARRAGRAAILELRLDPETITTRATLSQIRGRGRAKA